MTPWWTPIALEVEQAAVWRAGPVDVWVRRNAHEWRIAVDRSPERDDQEEVEVAVGAPWPEDTAAMEVVRFGMARTGPGLRIVPALAPRPMVCRPEQPFRLLPQGEVTAFVGCPLWMRVLAEDGALLFEVDLFQPSGTWFGPDTQSGELCYANRTRLRLHRERLQHSPLRAMTRLLLRNRTEEVLTLSQIKLPMPSLDLVVSERGRLWSQALEVEFARGGSAQIEVLPPLDPPRVSVLTPARLTRGPGRLISALSQVLR